jgi:hypothetical protein
MTETSNMIQLSYMRDTDMSQYLDLMTSTPMVRDRLVAAGAEHARRMSGHSKPRGSGAGQSWKPVRSLGCCANAGAGNLFDHCKGAEHVSAEFGLSEAAIPSVTSVAHLFGRARLAGALPQELDERGMRRALLRALNDSWRRLYRNAPAAGARADDEHRLSAGMKSSDDIFAERVARRAGARSKVPLPTSQFKAPRMVPGA